MVMSCPNMCGMYVCVFVSVSVHVYLCVVHTIRKDTTEHMLRCYLQYSNKWLYYIDLIGFLCYALLILSYL